MTELSVMFDQEDSSMPDDTSMEATAGSAELSAVCAAGRDRKRTLL